MEKNKGNWGEERVVGYLMERGYRVIERQFSCRYGEVDIVAVKDGIICFVEVKTRSQAKNSLPREAVGRSKRHRLRMAAQVYLQQHSLDCPARFDVAEVYRTQYDAPTNEPYIIYLEDAFT